MRLDLDTAHLILGTKGIMGIDPRCVPCSAKRRLSRQLEKRHGRDVLSSCDDSLRAILAESAEIPWRLDKSELFSKVLRYGDQVRSGEKPEQQVICLDLEYSSHTGKVLRNRGCRLLLGRSLMRRESKAEMSRHQPRPDNARDVDCFAIPKPIHRLQVLQ
jgi:hypothetical protein